MFTLQNISIKIYLGTAYEVERNDNYGEHFRFI